MDVSNASGYDGTTVAADACYLAKAAHGRSRVVITEATQPAGAGGRQDLRARLPARGRRGAHAAAATTDPDARRRASTRDAAAVIFQQPNFFGCFEAAAALRPPRGGGPGALAGRPRRPDQPRRARGARQLRLRARDRRGPVGRQPFMSYGGPHYGFLAAKEPYMRRLPGRIVGETVDGAGERGFVLTLQTREQHIRREKATSNITHQPDAARARRARPPLAARARGAARDGRDAAWRSPSTRASGSRRSRARAALPRQPDVQGVRARQRRRRRRRGASPRRARASTPATRSARLPERCRGGLLVAVTERRTARRDRPPGRDARAR